MADTPQIAHSKIGASSYYRWKKCPGSVQMSIGVEQVESSYATAGTVAHDIASIMLDDFFFSLGKPDIPPGYELEELDAVKSYVALIKADAVLNHCEASSGHVLIEHRFDLSKVHPGLFGTADAVLYNARDKKLLVYDYKHGAGIAVDVIENLQLQYYGLGALLSSGFPCSSVELIICQPRCSHSDGAVRRWSFNSVDLIEYAAELADDAKATEAKNPKLQPGEHCRFCPAAATKCPALRDQAKALAKREFNPTEEFREKEIKDALDIIPAVEAWIKNVREFAYQEASLGKVVPGYKLVAKRATRKWRLGEKETAAALVLLDSDVDFYERKLLSPPKAEKFLDKKGKELLKGLVMKQSSGHTLVNEADKRPAVKLDATQDFKQIKE